MANIILTAELNAVFTATVNKYLEQGMVFHANTMAGSQGEIAKIDLTDGKDVYRINMGTEHDHSGDWKNGFHGDIVEIMVEKHEGACDTKAIDTFRTIWTGKGELISKEVWYDVSGKRQAWTNDKDFAKACEKKRYSSDRDYFNVPEKEIALSSEERRNIIRDMCRQHKGYKSVRRVHLDKLVKRVNRFDGSIIYKVTFVDNIKNALVIKSIEK